MTTATKAPGRARLLGWVDVLLNRGTISLRLSRWERPHLIEGDIVALVDDIATVEVTKLADGRVMFSVEPRRKAA